MHKGMKVRARRDKTVLAELKKLNKRKDRDTPQWVLQGQG